MIMTFVDTTNQVPNKRNRFHWRNYYYRLSHITMTHFYWNFRPAHYHDALLMLDKIFIAGWKTWR